MTTRGLRQHYELVHVEYCTADAVSDTTQLPNALGSSTTMYLYFKLKHKKSDLSEIAFEILLLSITYLAAKGGLRLHAMAKAYWPK